jgi:lipoprotein signal peptidase
MGIGNTRWYTYNLADAFAVAGVIMLLAHEFFGWGRRKPAVPAVAKADKPSCAPGQN